MPFGLLRLSFNFWIVVVGAFALIGLIKLTSLLPSRYYFSFSKLMVGNNDPFLVDTPSVTGRKLCEFMKKQRISQEYVGSVAVNCALDVAGRQVGKMAFGEESALTAAQMGIVYDVASKNDEKVRAIVSSAVRRLELAPMSDDDIRAMAINAETPHEAFTKVLSGYEDQVYKQVGNAIAEYYGALLEGKIEESKEEETEKRAQREKLEATALSSSEINAIVGAHGAFAKDPGLRNIRLARIEKGAIDESLAKVTRAEADNVAVEIAKLYTDPLERAMQTALQRAFLAHGVDVKTRSQARLALLKEITADGLVDYLIAIGFRVLPVIAFGLVLGAAFGREQIGSIGFGAAFAAFLLCWPLLFSWERLVSYQWQGHRLAFTSFYLVYIFSFLMLARMSALLAVAVTQSMRRRAAEGGGAARISLAELAFNIGLGMAVNGLVYASAALLPSLAER